MNASYGLTSKFQVTIPKDIRQKMRLSSRDQVIFEQKGNDIVLRKAPSLMDIAQEMSAKFKASGLPPATQKDIDNARTQFYQQGTKWQ